MRKEIVNQVKSHRIIYLQLMFFVLSLIVASALFLANATSFHDTFFNFLRIKEMGLELEHGHFPMYSMYTTSLLGNATPTFYPWLCLIPGGLLATIIPMTKVLGIVTFIGVYSGFNVAYYSIRTLHKSNIFNILFTIIYVLSPLVFGIIYGQGDFGSLYAFLLMPLVLIGYIHWINSAHWKMMVIGIILVLYNSIPLAVCCIGCLMFWTFLNIKLINYTKVINLIKGMICTIMATAIVWLPIIILGAQNNIFTPSDFMSLENMRAIFTSNILVYFIPQARNIFDLLDE